MYNTINFKKDSSWSLNRRKFISKKRVRHRFITIREYIEKRKSRKKGEKKSWIEMIWKMMEKEGINVVNNSWEGININSERVKKVEWKEIVDLRGETEKIKNIIKKWNMEEEINDVREIIDREEKKLKSREQMLKEKQWRRIRKEDWEEIQK